MDETCKCHDEVMLARMASVMRHRLRNIAAGMRGALQVIEKETAVHVAPELHEYIPLLLRECDSLGDIAERLGRLYCPIDTSVGPMRGDLLVRQVVDEVSRLFPSSIVEIHGTCRVGVSPVLGAALKELLVNASETGPHASVFIQMEHDTTKVTWTVSDTGPGIVDVDMRKQAFDPFFTTRPRHLGVGLALAQRLVTAMGGSCVAMPPPDDKPERWIVQLTGPVIDDVLPNGKGASGEIPRQARDDKAWSSG